MIFSPDGRNQKSRAGLLLSAAAHTGLFILIYLALHAGKTRPLYRESRCCATALYWTGGTSAGSNRPHPSPRRKARRRPSPVPASPASNSPAPVATAHSQQPVTGIASPQQQPTLGTGSGDEDAEPALPVYFPRPAATDRSLLPASEQNIVVDVSISALGEVTDEKLVRGFGNSLDQIVLNTVKGWRFRPATLNGAAIASSEELVFPFGQNSPSADGTSS